MRACLEVRFGDEKRQLFDKTRLFLKCISAEPRRTRKLTKYDQKSDPLLPKGWPPNML